MKHATLTLSAGACNRPVLLDSSSTPSRTAQTQRSLRYIKHRATNTHCRANGNRHQTPCAHAALACEKIDCSVAPACISGLPPASVPEMQALLLSNGHAPERADSIFVMNELRCSPAVEFTKGAMKLAAKPAAGCSFQASEVMPSTTTWQSTQ